jgi:hypothetical protein
MQLPGGNQHHVPDPMLFDANYADAMNAERRADRGLMHRVEVVVLGVGAVVAVLIVAWMVFTYLREGG